MEIEYDPQKAESNITKHEVSFEDAATALYDPVALVQEDIDSTNENRWILIGLSNEANLLTVIYTLRGGHYSFNFGKKSNTKRG